MKAIITFSIVLIQLISTTFSNAQTPDYYKFGVELQMKTGYNFWNNSDGRPQDYGKGTFLIITPEYPAFSAHFKPKKKWCFNATYCRQYKFYGGVASRYKESLPVNQVSDVLSSFILNYYMVDIDYTLWKFKNLELNVGSGLAYRTREFSYLISTGYWAEPWRFSSPVRSDDLGVTLGSNLEWSFACKKRLYLTYGIQYQIFKEFTTYGITTGLGYRFNNLKIMAN